VTKKYSKQLPSALWRWKIDQSSHHNRSYKFVTILNFAQSQPPES